MKTTFIGILMLYLVSVEGFLELDILREMLKNEQDRRALRELDHDYGTPRKEIEAQVNEIVAKQSQEVQDAYKKLVIAEAAKDEAEFEADLVIHELRGASADEIELKRKVHGIELDMSLSRREAKHQIRKLLGVYGSQESGSGSMEHSAEH